MAIAILARNISPSAGSCIAPITALTGRTKFLADMQWSPLTKFDVDSLSLWKRLEAVKGAQGEIMLYDDRRSLKLCLGRNRRSGSLHLYNEGDIVDVYIPKMKKWSAPYRISHDNGRNVIVESNQRLFKHAKAWARMRGQEPQAISPGEVSPDPPSAGFPSQPHDSQKNEPPSSPRDPPSMIPVVREHQIDPARLPGGNSCSFIC